MREMGLTLKRTRRVLPVAGKCGLWLLSLQDLNDFIVCNIAHLIVLLHHVSILITDRPAIIGNVYQGSTRFVFSADIAVDAGPALFAVAGIGGTHGAILSVCQGAADRDEAIVAPIARGTRALAVEFIALGILATGERGEETVEAILSQTPPPISRDRKALGTYQGGQSSDRPSIRDSCARIMSAWV